MDTITTLQRQAEDLAIDLEAGRRRRVGRRATSIGPAILILFTVAATAAPPIVKGQVSWNGTTLEIDCGSTDNAERRCFEVLAQPRILMGRTFTCDAGARTNGRCPDTITGEQMFPRRKAQGCTDQDIPSTRGRCLYGLGADVDTFGDLPTCDAGEWGHIALVKDEDFRYFCNGSTWEQNQGRVPGQWYAPAIQCGAGPTHDVWPDGGALLSVTTTAGLPPCVTETQNLRAWVGATNSARPHVDGTMYRCNSLVWGLSSAYREDVTDASITDICRTWANTGEFWIPPVPLSCTGDNWLCLVAEDALERYIEGVFFGSRDTGRKNLNDQRNPVVEE